MSYAPLCQDFKGSYTWHFYISCSKASQLAVQKWTPLLTTLLTIVGVSDDTYNKQGRQAKLTSCHNKTSSLSNRSWRQVLVPSQCLQEKLWQNNKTNFPFGFTRAIQNICPFSFQRPICPKHHKPFPRSTFPTCQKNKLRQKRPLTRTH